MLQENINSGLPKTSDLKMVDFWLMGGMVVPFVVFVVLVVVEVQSPTRIPEKIVVALFSGILVNSGILVEAGRLHHSK